jgi:hypothetical protein
MRHFPDAAAFMRYSKIALNAHTLNRDSQTKEWEAPLGLCEAESKPVVATGIKAAIF